MGYPLGPFHQRLLDLALTARAGGAEKVVSAKLAS